MITRGLGPVNGIWYSVLLVGEIGFATLGVVVVVSIMHGRSFKRAGEASLCFVQVSLQESIARDFLRSVLMFQGRWMCREQVEWSVDQGFAELDGHCLCCSWEIFEV
jgi:hypothetical protein